ncbi:hypothetical protein A0H81_14782 [Grifola frondosa]|uniref:Uncharacterized protein n=1 Tax=Grifola frondosa TaxID=5627 RepID=A0A1C7LR75_GRIFR|nr:hypothetical protein A0H81_14782 [Grifola frondosa]
MEPAVHGVNLSTVLHGILKFDNKPTIAGTECDCAIKQGSKPVLCTWNKYQWIVDRHISSDVSVPVFQNIHENHRKIELSRLKTPRVNAPRTLANNMSVTLADPSQAPYDVEANRIVLVGYCLGCIGYGISSTLFILCSRALYHRVRKNRTSAMLMVYICIMFLLSSLGNAFDIEQVTLGFVEYRDYPGGFYQSEIPLNRTWLFNGSHILFIISSVLQDSLLLYRFWIIYSGNFIILFLPTLMFVGITISSCVFIGAFMRDDSDFLAKSSVSIGLVQVSISLAFNVLVTAMIVPYIRHLGSWPSPPMGLGIRCLLFFFPFSARSRRLLHSLSFSAWLKVARGRKIPLLPPTRRTSDLLLSSVIQKIRMPRRRGLE